MNLRFVTAGDPADVEPRAFMRWPVGASIPVIAAQARREAAALPSTQILYLDVPSAGVDVRHAWQVMEAAGRANIRLAWPADTFEPPSLVVPTLNLRIGLLRVTKLDERAKDYVRRLAGVGSSAYVVIDPPAGEDRIADAHAAMTALHAIVAPPKPAKSGRPAFKTGHSDAAPAGGG